MRQIRLLWDDFDHFLAILEVTELAQVPEIKIKVRKSPFVILVHLNNDLQRLFVGIKVKSNLENRLQLFLLLSIVRSWHRHNLLFSFLPVLIFSIILTFFRLNTLQLFHHPHILFIVIFELDHSQYVVDVLNVASAQRFNYDELQKV